MPLSCQRLELTEYQPLCLPERELSDEQGLLIHSRYSNQISLEWPTALNDRRWRLVPQGWVGHLPVTPDLTISVGPKAPLHNVFGMLEYVYNFPGIKLHEKLVGCDSLDDFFERLAHILADNILDRARQGFYRFYLHEADRLPFARGRLDLPQALRTPWQAHLPWEYEEHTPDIPDNQILAWTMHWVSRAPMARPEVKRQVRRAHAALQGVASLVPFAANDCTGRTYHRLNEDYQKLHALCRFFLEHCGPRHEFGARDMIPFMLDMARLYEAFVAVWLHQHLPPGLRLRTQYPRPLTDDGLKFRMDMVLFDRPSGSPLCVMDTKYKVASEPSTDDVAQVVAYAHALGCPEATLVYPVALAKPLDVVVGKTRVRSVTFGLEGDLEVAAGRFLDSLHVHPQGG